MEDADLVCIYTCFCSPSYYMMIILFMIMIINDVYSVAEVRIWFSGVQLAYKKWPLLHFFLISTDLSICSYG